MSSMRGQWRKELRGIASKIRRLSRDERNENRSYQKLLAAMDREHMRVIMGCEEMMETLRKRGEILSGRLSQ